MLHNREKQACRLYAGMMKRALLAPSFGTDSQRALTWQRCAPPRRLRAVQRDYAVQTARRRCPGGRRWRAAGPHASAVQQLSAPQGAVQTEVVAYAPANHSAGGCLCCIGRAKTFLHKCFAIGSSFHLLLPHLLAIACKSAHSDYCCSVHIQKSQWRHGGLRNRLQLWGRWCAGLNCGA